MGGVLFVHSDPTFRETFAVALRIRGIEVVPYDAVQDALSEAARKKPVALLIEPKLFFREAEELAPKVAKIAGRSVRVVALTNRPSAEERDYFKRHGAHTLAGPIEDIDRIVTSLEKLVATGGEAEAPWETSTPISAPWEQESGAPAKKIERVSLPRRVDKVGPLPPPTRPPPASKIDEEWLFGDTHDVALPMPTVPPSAEPAAARVRGVEDAQLAREGQGPTILIVDDDATFRFFLCEALAEKKYRVYISINGPNALRFLKAAPDVALVVTDVNMPHMDGFELKHESDMIRRIPFIAVTGELSAERTEIAKQVGVFGLVSKPIRDLDDFYALVERAIEKR